MSTSQRRRRRRKCAEGIKHIIGQLGSQIKEAIWPASHNEMCVAYASHLSGWCRTHFDMAANFSRNFANRPADWRTEGDLRSLPVENQSITPMLVVGCAIRRLRSSERAESGASFSSAFGREDAALGGENHLDLIMGNVTHRLLHLISLSLSRAG